MLTENPELKFKSKAGYEAKVCGNMFRLTGPDRTRRFHNDDEWTLEKEYMTFDEAKKSGKVPRHKNFGYAVATNDMKALIREMDKPVWEVEE